MLTDQIDKVIDILINCFNDCLRDNVEDILYKFSFLPWFLEEEMSISFLRNQNKK